MGQCEILELMKKNKDKWYSVNEVVEELGTCRSAVGKSLGKLYFYRFIERREVIINRCRVMRFEYRIKESTIE